MTTIENNINEIISSYETPEKTYYDSFSILSNVEKYLFENCTYNEEIYDLQNIFSANRYHYEHWYYDNEKLDIDLLISDY